MELVCSAFNVHRSCYYEHRKRCQRIDAKRVQVNHLFNQSRSSAGNLTIQGLLNEQGEEVCRFKVRSLMRELGLICKQPGPHAYKQATVERPDIPNHPDQEFTVATPNQVWCGDITYIWTGQCWSYLADRDCRALRMTGLKEDIGNWGLLNVRHKKARLFPVGLF